MANSGGAQAAPPAPPPVEAVPPRTPTRKLIGDTDDEIPNDAELIEMSPRAFRSRLDRFTKKQIKERFGTDDMETLQARLQRLQEYETAAEQKRLADMTETERLREQLEAEKAARLDAENRFTEAENGRIIDEMDRLVMGYARQYLDPDYYDVEIERLKGFVKSCSESDLANPEELVESWFKRRIESKPKLGKDFGAPAGQGQEQHQEGASAAPPAAPPAAPTGGQPTRPTLQMGQNGQPPKIQIPFTNGTAPSRPAAQQGASLGPKTAAPGKANSMNDAEVRDLKKALNLHW